MLDISPQNSFTYGAPLSGVAPHAHIIAYDACFDGLGCFLSSLVAAIEQAVIDGVDVINYSIGGASSDPWIDPDAQAFLGAVSAGVVSVASAGNSGPESGTVGSPADAPWILTVGASAHTRSSSATLADFSGGNTAPPSNLIGQGLTVSYGPARIVYAGAKGDAKCLNPFPANTWTQGEIVVCDRGVNGRTQKGVNIMKGGAKGMVLVDIEDAESVAADPHVIPAIHLGKSQGSILKTWLASGSNHMATIRATQIAFSPANADSMAGFSSRGPNTNVARDIIKPDVTAPGVSVFAAYRSGSGPAGDGEPWMDEFSFLSGTSMASPHVAGSAVLLRSIHPNWTPTEIKSALMNTAVVAGVRKEDNFSPADAFDMGAGRIDVSRAANAGLVLDILPAEFFAADPAVGGDLAALNLASLADSSCQNHCTWTRRLRNPTSHTLSFHAGYDGDANAIISPSVITLPPGDSAVIRVTLDVSNLTDGKWAFGLVTWDEVSGLAPDAHFPVAVLPATPVADLNVIPAQLVSNQAAGGIVTHTLLISNTGAARLDWEIVEDADNSQAPSQEITLDVTSSGSESELSPNTKPVLFKVDDGDAEDAVGLPGGGQFLWINRFSPDASEFPISLEDVQVLFDFHVHVGDLVDIYVYEDKDGDGNPGTGAVHRATLNNQSVQSINGNTFSEFTFSTPVMLNGPGDILIGIVNRTAGIGAGEKPAALDSNSIKRRRSWIGSYNGIPGDPPLLPATQNWGVVDDSAFGLDGNWMIRGRGKGRAPCDAPVDIPWLKEITPAAGSVPAGGSSQIGLTFDASGLAQGEYLAKICINSNDPDMPRVVIPVTLNVSNVPAIQVFPSTLHTVAPNNQQSTQSLSVHNVGGAPLSWAVVETRSTGSTSESEAISALSATAVVLYNQTDHPGSNAIPSQFFPDYNGQIRGADDFVVPAADGGWSVERITVPGIYTPNAGPAPSFDVVIFSNKDNLPDIEIFRASKIIPGSDHEGSVTLQLPQPALLPPGAYWLSVVANMPFRPGSQQWGWLTREVQSGRPYVWEDTDGLIGSIMCRSWKPGAAVCNIGGIDGVGDPDALFRFEGVKGKPACSAAGDIPWIQLSPANGVIPPGADQPVQVTYDTSGLPPGRVAGLTCITSNDPNQPYILIPVTLDVLAEWPGGPYLPLLLR